MHYFMAALGLTKHKICESYKEFGSGKITNTNNCLNVLLADGDNINVPGYICWNEDLQKLKEKIHSDIDRLFDSYEKDLNEVQES